MPTRGTGQESCDCFLQDASRLYPAGSIFWGADYTPSTPNSALGSLQKLKPFLLIPLVQVCQGLCLPGWGPW